MIHMVFFAPYPEILPTIEQVFRERPDREELDYKVVLDFFNNPLQDIDADVIIGQNTVIYPQNVLQGKTIIGDNVVLQVGNTIIDSSIGNGSNIMHSVIINSKITNNSSIEPFSYINKGIVKK